jgi:hypothetical protein
VGRGGSHGTPRLQFWKSPGSTSGFKDFQKCSSVARHREGRGMTERGACTMGPLINSYFIRTCAKDQKTCLKNNKKIKTKNLKNYVRKLIPRMTCTFQNCSRWKSVS